MASKYAKQFALPENFPGVLKGFAKELLRKQPEDIGAFAVAYFDQALVDLSAAEAAKAKKTYLTVEQLETGLRSAFAEFDRDSSGSLNLDEFKEVIKDSGLFDLEFEQKEKEERRLLAEVDVNQDGEIDYVEFIPMASEWYDAMLAKMQHFEEQDEAESAAVELIKGMQPPELEALLNTVFAEADKDASGDLDPVEFRKCLTNAALGLSRKEINLLMLSADQNGDGRITFAEFAPLCVKLLVEVIKEEIIQAKAPTELEKELMLLFEAADGSRCGRLEFDEAQALLQSANLGLTSAQILSVLAEAEVVDEEIEYAVFVPTAASLVSRMLDVRAARAK